jgi:AraC family transcriptional regulator
LKTIMNRSTLLAATTDLTVSRFDHPAGEAHHDPDREVADNFSIAFVETGSFELECEGRRSTMAPGSVLLTRPGLEFRCRHGAVCPDDVCVSIRFAPSAVAGMTDAWHRPGTVAQRRASPRLALVQSRLTMALEGADAFNTERWAIAALQALVADLGHAASRGPYTPRHTDLDAVLAACRDIEAHPSARVSVAERARVVHMTGTRLTHAFRRYLGVSPHQYVVRWRLAYASDLLSNSCGVSESCYRAGFENLSHFCRSFQRAFGCRPSQWRAWSLHERRRKVQAMLEGRS